MKKKFWIAILTAVLLLNLLPGMTPSASADDTQSLGTIGQTCPNKQCKAVTNLEIIGYRWRIEGFQPNEKQHWLHVLCPVCGKDGYLAGEDHVGGTETPTCTTGKTCEKCGGEYGILGHDLGDWQSNGDNTHTRTCRREGCGETETGNCNSSTAHCGETGKCDVCGGDYYHAAHAFPNRWKWESDTEVGRDAESHWVWCLYCTEGKSYYSTHSFSPTNMYLASPATCVSKPVYYKNCATCLYKGTETYENEWDNVDPNNHTGNEEIRGAVEATCTTAGYTGDTYCKDCDALLSTGTAIPATGEHTGGTPTCLRRAKCEVCGERYGDIDRSNHVDGCVPEWTVTETEHTQKYSRCGKLLTETGAHTFGDWTVTQEPTESEEGEQERVCTLCGHTETEAIPVVEVKASPSPAPTATPEPTAEPAAEPAEPASTSSAWWIIALIVVAGVGTGIAVRQKKKK